ncbi:uncharacterized protein LOC113846788 [Abrus precatorius]|uniref:Uncharacterized protein LOC113846788 n=1 Tax=Abrus precatorius TaxID=3816 RepID=A0A8B8JJ03_ABRPR|nr:uncharacterized protein LOC113846788 [Abrus precatorius]XP_027331229.1 uncharacterized protein LOC113846788 [Abrus precatorius]
MKKKRSRVSRRPRANADALFQCYFGWVPLEEPFGKQDENEKMRDTMVASGGLRTGNKPKKLKLKLGGVTHTIHTKSKTETGFSGGSFVTNFSEGPKPQDDTNGNDACSFDKRRGLGDASLKPSRTESGFTAENHSHRGKRTEQSVNVIHERVHKSKRITRKGALSVGFSDEDNEDAELHYRETSHASKQAVSRRRDDCRSSTVPGKFYVAQRSQIDDLIDLGTPGSIEDGKKKLNLEKKSDDWDYVEEDPTSSDESESERKMSKRESVHLFVQGKEGTIINRNCSVDSFKDVLSSIVDISDDSVPTVSKRKRGKLSEMELQLKKAEAAQRRKIQSEKAARDAEAAAIRKILGQESGRKKKQEKMNKRRDEFAKEKSTNTLILGSNTVRWTMGPQGTVVTFSEDIGLPSIFQMIRSSYPPPREKCAGPNCTNVYKYRDSKSKLPLCSLGCFKAIREKIQHVVAC